MSGSLSALALYDFEEENPGELSIHAGEQLTLSSAHEVDGWLEGTNSQGKRGLFPATYVEVSPRGPQRPPAVTPARYQNVPSYTGNGGRDPDPRGYEDDDDDDDWDDDEWDDATTIADGDTETRDDHGYRPAFPGSSAGSSGGASRGAPHLPSSPAASSSSYSRPARSALSRSASVGAPSAGAGAPAAAPAAAQQPRQRGGTVGKNFNRFSTFVKSGGEAFVLGEACADVRPAERVRIEHTEGARGPRLRWSPSDEPFSCSVEQPKRETKFKGMKSYISYMLLPSWPAAAAVTRRYKHFDWLHSRLLQKYPVISVPQLPEKQATGRFEDGFIEKRQRGLALWLGHTAAHPVLAQCAALRHFLTCADEREWKAGKRRAERDELTGANFFLTLEVPPVTLELGQVDVQVDTFKVFLRRMEESVGQLSATAQELCRKHTGGFKREFHKAGAAFRALSLAFDSDPDRSTDPLNYALGHTGDTYVAVGEMFAEQPANDLQPMLDVLGLYQGLLGNFPDIITVMKGALTKVRESQRVFDEGRMEAAELGEVRRRCNIMAYATLAEMNHLHEARLSDTRRMMRAYLQQQVAFYHRVGAKLEETLRMYDTQHD